MDELDKQLAELQLITQSELKQNPNATDASQVKKKIGPAVPPKPKKIYSNLPQIGVPKPFEKTEVKSTHNSTALTYSNQDGLIYSNILHEPSKTSAPLNHTFTSDNSLYSNVQIKNMTVVEDLPPPPPLELSPDYVQCNVPPPFPPPPIPSEDNEDDLPPPPPVISSGSTQDFNAYDPHISNNSVYTPMGGSAYLPKSVSPNLSYTQNSVSPNRLLQHSVSPTRYNSPSSVTPDNRENTQYPPKSVSPQYYQGGYQTQERYPETQFSTAEPQVPNSKSTGRLNYISPNYENQSIYANQPKNLYSNEGISRDNTPNLVSPKNNLYSNVPMHQYNQQNVHLQHFTNNCPTYENTVLQQKNMNEIQETSSGNSVLNYPGSSVSDYANQVQMFRPGSSASNYIPNVGFDSSVSLQQRSDFRSGSSASNYLPQDFENQTESIYAPLRRPEDNDLPPPPPIMNNKTRPNLPPIITCGINDDSVGGEDIPAPASPVSSSYSELRRATDLGGSHGFNPYAPGSHTSSTYESIYEPINPRPPSQASARSGYSLYGGHTGTLNSQKQSNELEVDQLTNLLVQSMDPSSQEEYFEICVKCNQSIIGEENGCTAMDKFYHVNCFTCFECNINLQGKPFYSLEGKPYCKQDYLNTLEKCCVCMEPILDRILRATGKPYHPKCFTCVVCGKSLDGIPFTVDATNQIHCIEDFHKKFAPRCCVCKLPIMPENGQEETVRVVALDRSFHVGCYKCEDCGLVLSSEAEGRGCYPLDDHVLCKNCNAKRVQALTLHMTTDL